MNLQAINNSAQSRTPTSVRWRWNLPLLFSSIGVFLLLTIGLKVASRYRTSQVVLQLSQLASQAHDAGDLDREVRWLSQLLSIDPKRKNALVRLAFATNENANTMENLEIARRSIVNAIAALDPIQDESTIAELRRELIQRLLDMGVNWANELERQIVLLNAPPDDPQSTLWLGKSLYERTTSGEWRSRNKAEHQQGKEYWKWLSSQPVGDVLELAVEKNPDSIELAVALLDSYYFHTDLFSPRFARDAKASCMEKGAKLLASLQQIENGLAQWKSYSCEVSIDPLMARKFLSNVAPQALKRLQSSEYGRRNPIHWDLQIALTEASQLLNESDFTGAIALYRQLLGMKQEAFPVRSLESLYVGIGQALFRSGEIDGSIAILKEGCQRIGKNQGLAIFDTYTTYACAHADVDQATKAISELNEAIDAHVFQPSSGSALRGEAKTNEQHRINLTKWHAEVVHAGFDLRIGDLEAAIARLKVAVATQLQIPKRLRVEASAILARAYTDMQLWDLAARTLDDALELAPSDRSLRFQAAKVSERAGALSRAAEHWKLLDDGSFESGLQVLQSIIANQRSVPASRRDPRVVDQAFEQAKLRLLEEKKSGVTANREWLLDWLEVCMTTSEVELKGKLRSLMRKHRENAELLSLVITAFASVNDQEMVTEGIGILASLKEQNPALWSKTSLKLAFEAQDVELASDLTHAKQVIEHAIAQEPNDIESKLALVEYYRAIGDQLGVVASLEEAVQLAPSRVDIRNTLAMALVTDEVDSKSLPWKRIASLVSVEDNASAAGRNKLFHAMLLASRGEEQQEQQARDILGKLIDADDSETSDDALRYLIILDQKVWKMSISTGNAPRSRELSLEIQHRFDQLTNRRSPAPMDLVQYVEFLLLSEKTDDVPLLLERLESAMGITPQTLALRIRLAHLKNETDRIREIIVQSIADENEREVSARIIALSEMLAQSGLKEESIQSLHAAYEKSPVHLRALVDRLMNQGDFQKGLDVCLERAKIDNSPELTSLIADSWTGRDEWDSKAETIDFILERGLMNHPNDATVLESVGSLRLSQFRYEEAFRLLEAANRISPDSLLTLNNLAIAASEIPGRQVFARAMIERAISKYGRIPDLLDSHGLVLLQCGAYQEAKRAFDDAFALRPDPRFRLHRIQVAMADSNPMEIDKLTKAIDIASLQSMRLPPSERIALDRLLQQKTKVTP